MAQEKHEQQDSLSRPTRLERIRHALILGGASGIQIPRIDTIPKEIKPLPGTIRTEVLSSQGTKLTRDDVSLDE